MKTAISTFYIIFILFPAEFSGQPSVVKTSGSIVSAHPLATQAGLAILNRGGNAFDATIAVAAALNVVEPMMSGIGGYGTILIYDAGNNRIRYLNPSGRFPLKTDSDLMREPTPDFMKNRYGPKSISTPGNLNAWKELHKNYGVLEWEILFRTAIDLAEQGFKIDRRIAGSVKNAFDNFSEYTRSFYGKEGKPLKNGDKLIQLDLANTFRIISTEGVSPFYTGRIAESIDRQMRISESFLSIDDLRKNEAEWWDPLKMNYRGYDIYTASLPANSFAAFVNIGLMQQIPQGDLQHNSADYLHLFAEMTKESYKARLAFSFDPDMVEAPLDSILSQEVLESMATSLNRNRATIFKPPHSGKSVNTTHFVVIDRLGNIVCATQTLGNAFGSRIMVEGTGIWMNNSMAYSTFEPKGNPMDSFPGRHKLSGDCPVIIMKNDKPWAALGTPGGHTITQNVPQIIFNLIDFQMTMQEAIDAPKISFVEPDIILVDPFMPVSLLRKLKDKGHRIRKGLIGNANGIRLLYNETGEIGWFQTGTDKRGK